MTGPRGMRVEARAATRAFAGGAAAAVDGASLVLEPGEFVALAGRSGSGKTTLLSLLGGLDRPDSGSVLLDGADLAAASRAGRTRVAREIGFVLQGSALLRRMPAWENVACGLVPLGLSSAERRSLAEAALRRVSIEALADRRPEALSAGERQRVALARALVASPRLLLADEPTSDLDPESAAVVRDVLAAAREEGATVLAATHDPALLERAGRTLRIERGRLA